MRLDLFFYPKDKRDRISANRTCHTITQDPDAQKHLYLLDPIEPIICTSTHVPVFLFYQFLLNW